MKAFLKGVGVVIGFAPIAAVSYGCYLLNHGAGWIVGGLFAWVIVWNSDKMIERLKQ